jgi:hypothetical protein
MSGAVPPVPNTSSWRAQLKAVGQVYLHLYMYIAMAEVVCGKAQCDEANLHVRLVLWPISTNVLLKTFHDLKAECFVCC